MEKNQGGGNLGEYSIICIIPYPKLSGNSTLWNILKLKFLLSFRCCWPFPPRIFFGAAGNDDLTHGGRPRTLVYTDLVEVLGERPHPIKSEISKFVTAGVVQIFLVMTLGERGWSVHEHTKIKRSCFWDRRAAGRDVSMGWICGFYMVGAPVCFSLSLCFSLLLRSVSSTHADQKRSTMSFDVKRNIPNN